MKAGISEEDTIKSENNFVSPGSLIIITGKSNMREVIKYAAVLAFPVMLEREADARERQTTAAWILFTHRDSLYSR